MWIAYLSLTACLVYGAISGWLYVRRTFDEIRKQDEPEPTSERLDGLF